MLSFGTAFPTELQKASVQLTHTIPPDPSVQFCLYLCIFVCTSVYVCVHIYIQGPGVVCHKVSVDSDPRLKRCNIFFPGWSSWIHGSRDSLSIII